MNTTDNSGTTWRIGDMVCKNETTWVPSDFDSWGRGIGIGIIVKPPFLLGDDYVDVRWEAGRCFEEIKQLRKADKQ